MTTLVVLTCLPGTSRAQVLAEDPAGYPVRTEFIYLQAGHTYDISTNYNLTHIPGFWADSVLSLVPYGSETAVAGADGCFTSTGFEWEPSCFQYTPPSSGWFILFLRAWTTTSPGQTYLWTRDITAGGGWVAETSSSVTFGGGKVLTSQSSGRLYLNTQARPGNNAAQTLWTFQNEWKLRRVNTYDGLGSGAAALDVPDVASAGLGGVLYHVFGSYSSTAVGASRLLQNDWFLPGQDFDGDGLGSALEADLQTCDRSTDPNPSALFSCADLVGCGVDPSGDTCRASLRDTDHDGLRDDLETWGYSSILELPRYGADPARMDVFIELDAYDQNRTLTGCQGFESWPSPNGINNGDTVPFFDRLESVYGTRRYIDGKALNPNGSDGIRLHFDVGINNPDPTDDRWGNWGGGNTCVPLTGPDTCGYKSAYNGNCPPINPFNTDRAWVFFYGLDVHGGTSLGQAASGGETYSAQNLSHHAHEIGHLAHLTHQGPPGSASWNSWSGNHRPNYGSRMNYLYQNVGGTGGTDQTDWEGIGFGDGRMAGVLPLDHASEVCPLPGADLDNMNLVGIDATLGPGGCWDVDWNEDGNVSGVQPLAHYQRRIERDYRNYRLALPRAVRSPYSLAIVEDLFLLAGVTETAGGWRAFIRGDSDADCAVEPIPVRSAGGRDVNPLVGASGSYPGCMRPGGEILIGQDADAVAIVDGLINTTGGLVEGLVLVGNDDGTLIRGTVDVAPTSTSQEIVLSYTGGAALAPGSSYAASMAAGTRAPALARHPSTDATILVYLGADGQLRQSSLSPGGLLWATPTVSTDTSGTPLVASTSPSLTDDGTNVYLLFASPVDNRVRVYVRSGAQWLLVVTTTVQTATRPSAVIAPDPIATSQDRMYLYYQDLSSLSTRWAQSNLDDFTTFAGAAVFRYGQSAGAPAVVWDDRSVLTTAPDVRLVDLRHGGNCTATSGCAAWQDASLPPPVLCMTSISRCMDVTDPSDFNFVGEAQLLPFGRGRAQGIYTDYDDWPALRWGYCRSLTVHKNGNAPDFTDGFTPTSFRGTHDCGPMPTYTEPMLTGMAVTGLAPLNDEALYPWLYEVGPEHLCDNPY